MIFSPRTPRATRALGLLVLAVAFAAGAIVATALDQVLHADEAPGAASAAQDSCDEPRIRLLDQVELTAEQRASIDAILDRRREQTDSVWSEARPTLRVIMDTTRAEIRAVLTPEQRETYDRLRRERKAAERAREAERDARGDSGPTSDSDRGNETEAPR